MELLPQLSSATHGRGEFKTHAIRLTRSYVANLDFGESLAPACATHEEAGFLSADRWGIGSLVMIGGFMGTGAFLLFRWAGTRSGFSLGLAVLLVEGVKPLRVSLRSWRHLPEIEGSNPSGPAIT